MKRQDIWGVLFVSLIITIPFLGKPVHIDDTFVLRITARILEAPLDPFAGEIDWFGHLMPVWKATTNPPLISYFLAPLALLSDYSEIIMHSGMVLFHVLLIGGTVSLTRRFTRFDWLPALFVALSSAVIVSGNLMRDIPAAGLAVAGVACFVYGTDHRLLVWNFTGAGLIGLAVLTKYPLAVAGILILLYAFMKRDFRGLYSLALPTVMILLWFGQNLVYYGQIHPIYLLLERSSESNITWNDKMLGGFSVLGSAIYLVPIIIWNMFSRKRLGGVVALVLLGFWVYAAARLTYGDSPDWEFLFWAWCGTLLLFSALSASFGKDAGSDEFFLVVWLLLPFLFSIFLVPFQATRHLIFALPPLVLLSFGDLGKESSLGRERFLSFLLLMQAMIAMIVQGADYQYAHTYRSFAEVRSHEWVASKRATWYVGHWGWKFYADQAGMRQLHRDGPYPRRDDLLIWPSKVHVGDVFSRLDDPGSALRLIESVRYRGTIPIRTMSGEDRAGFYATIRRRIPYRFGGESLLEEFRIFEITRDLKQVEDDGSEIE